MQEQKAIHIKAENFDGCMAFVVELGKMLTEKEITMATIERSHGDMVKITTYRSNETTTPAGKGYTFSSHQDQDGIKMDITISTEKHMAMSELLARYAAMSHGVYLELAKDISAHRV